MDRKPLATLRRTLFAIFTLALAAAALFWALRDLDWTAFEAQLASLDWRWLALAVVFDFASYTAQGLRWRFLLRGASLWQTTRAIYAGLFVNELVPLRPGEALRAWIAARDLNLSVLRVAPTILAERWMDGLWLAAALLEALRVAPLPPTLAHVAWTVVAVIAALFPVAWILMRARLSGRRIEWIHAVSAGMKSLPAVFASAGFLLAQGLAFWAVMQASHLPLDLVDAFVVMLIVRIGTMIPGAPANLGTHQFSTVLGLSLFGVTGSAAAGFSLVVFIVLTAPLLTAGFFACLNAGFTLNGIRHLTHSEALS